MFRIQNSVFVIIDAQDFCVNIRGNESGLKAALDNVILLLDDARKTAAMPIFHVAMSTYDIGAEKCLRYLQQDYLLANADLHLIRGCEPQGHEGFFLKRDYSAFSNGAFLGELKAYDIKRIYLCGFHTSACVEQTALDTMKNGFEVCLVEGATASPYESRTREGIETIQKAGGEIISVHDFRMIIYPSNPILLGLGNPHYFKQSM